MEEMTIEIERKLSLLNRKMQQEKPFLQEYLNKIELSILKTNNDLEMLLKNIKKNKLSLSSISKDTSVSRQTLYNNPILKDYIELSIRERENYNPMEYQEKLKKEISLLKKEIQIMEYRDLQNEILKQSIKQLSTTITARNKEITDLRERNADLVKRLNLK